MRKFRAWDKKHNEMIYAGREGALVIGFDGVVVQMGYDGIESTESELIPLESTGLEDKNGKEIYEGDILAHKGIDVNKKPIETRFELKYGWYDNGKSYEDNVSGYGWWLLETIFLRDGKIEDWGRQVRDINSIYGIKEIEVIGNIYEHSELLKEG